MEHHIVIERNKGLVHAAMWMNFENMLSEEAVVEPTCYMVLYEMPRIDKYVEAENKLVVSRALKWRRKWQPTPVFLPGESQGRGSLVGCRLWGCTESDTTEAT